MSDYKELVKALRHYSEVAITVGVGELVCDAAAAIEDLQKDLATLQKCYGIADTTVDEVLKQLPKRGEWIKDEEQSQKHVEAIYTCSACHNFDAWGVTELYPYCPNCGAKMEADNG